MEGNQLQRFQGNTLPAYWTPHRVRQLELDNIAHRARKALRAAGATLLVEERNSYGFPVLTIRAEPALIARLQTQAAVLRRERHSVIPRMVARLFGVDVQWEDA